MDSKHLSSQPNVSIADRAAGAIMGVLIGDALGLGCHWYYDIEQLKARYGYVKSYVAAKPDWYHAGVKPGEGSNTGDFIRALIESVAEKGCYDRADFTRRLDVILDALDGTPENGRAGHVDENVRGVWQSRKVKKLNWGDDGFAVSSLTSEAAQRNAVLAARYATNMRKLAVTSFDSSSLTYVDKFVTDHSTTFALHVASCIRGGQMDGSIHMRSKRLLSLLSEEEKARGVAPSFDTFLTASYVGSAATTPGVSIEPPTLASAVYGRACGIEMVLCSAYYIAARFPFDFEKAVLTAVNSGGNNMARAAIVGGLVGGTVGLSGIPKRFITELADSEKWLRLARKIAEDAERDMDSSL